MCIAWQAAAPAGHIILWCFFIRVVSADVLRSREGGKTGDISSVPIRRHLAPFQYASEALEFYCSMGHVVCFMSAALQQRSVLLYVRRVGAWTELHTPHIQQEASVSNDCIWDC